jgi:hypothetical protein
MTKQATKKTTSKKAEKRIFKKVKENPHTKGSRRFKAFANLKSGTKVADAKLASPDLAFMVNKGYVELRSSK